MKRSLLMSVSAIALIASAGFATAQDKGMPGGGASQAPQQSAPAPQSAPSAQPGGEMKGGGAIKGGAGTTGQGSAEPRANPGEPRDQKGDRQQRSQDQRQPDQKGAQDKGAQDKSAPPSKGTASDTKSDRKGATTGQGAAGSSGSASLTTEQRTKISTTIRQTNVRPVTNVNFNVSVGTVVPRSVSLHALPAAVIEVYPDWRPYRFVLVGDEIIIIDPATYRIVAVIPA